MEKLLLFDIDGTLMEESPTHTYSFNYVCERIYGVKTDIESFPRHGMTDTGILYGLLKKQNIPEIEIKRKINEAFRTMEEYVSSNIKPADYALLPLGLIYVFVVTGIVLIIGGLAEVVLGPELKRRELKNILPQEDMEAMIL